MKIIKKGISLFFGTVMLTSCNSFASSPALSPTGVMETAMSTVKTAIVETQTAIPTNTPSPQPPTPISPTPIPPLPTPSFSFPVDTHDPESVIRAWLDAWERSDGNAMAWAEGKDYANYGFDGAIDSIEVVEIKLKSSPSQTERIYYVVFDIQFKKGQEEGHNLRNGKVEWTFTLTWDSSRDSWFVTNHGYG